MFLEITVGRLERVDVGLESPAEVHRRAHQHLGPRRPQRGLRRSRARQPARPQGDAREGDRDPDAHQDGLREAQPGKVGDRPRPREPKNKSQMMIVARFGHQGNLDRETNTPMMTGKRRPSQHASRGGSGRVIIGETTDQRSASHKVWLKNDRPRREDPLL
ncbi:hypothetical protein RRG08_036662 [Elysia crispata]|uniref:Uncharacterized protein n=1 Tax=Elysia crispata TaxID=231223 RepID=A0AAE1DXQ1_9GAST|nr:hypothetical protein RRG08_036662 [Elysia crispata]